MPEVAPIPQGFHSITPHLVIKNASEAIEFYKKAFGAQELARFPMPGGELIMHAEVKIGDSILMMVDEFPEGEGCPGSISPLTAQGTTVSLHLYVEDADAVYQRAVDAGCTPVMEPMDAFWGDRFGQVLDPYGHSWSIATHQADLTEEQMAQAAQEMFATIPAS